MRVLVHYEETDAIRERIEARFPDIEVASCTSYAALPRALGDFAPEALFSIRFENRPYPREAVLSAASLKWVSVGGVGVDHVHPWDPARITVTNGAGVASEVIATYVVGGIVALAMGFPRFLRRQSEHRWAFDHVHEVIGRRVCVVGLGHTGQHVARMAAALGLTVVGTRARPAPTAHVERVYGPGELHQALAGADYVVVAVPLVDSTRRLINAAALAAMKDGAALIDVSRGGVVDQPALARALRDGKLGGAVLDVFETEPLPPESPLWDMENVLITPHCSSVYPGWEVRAADMFCDNLARWRAGAPLVNVVDPARGY